MKEIDLIIDSKSGEGSWNMSVDEFLFRCLEKNVPHTVLRFYSWKRPTVSLGYSQKISRVVDVEYCQANHIDIVRRITGGKLVLHHREVTYSLVSSDSELFPPTVAESYKHISEALMIGLRQMGLDPTLADVTPEHYARGNLPCFSYPARDEVKVRGKKIIGSAQKRLGPLFLQHGSIPIEEDDELLRRVSLLKTEGEEIAAISLSKAVRRKTDFYWIVPHFCHGISEYFDVRLKPRHLNADEKKTIRCIQKERYANSDWTFGT